MAGSDARMWSDRAGIFAPGTPMATEVGLPPSGARPDLAALRRALAEAGYAGEQVAMRPIPGCAPVVAPSRSAGADIPAIDTLRNRWLAAETLAAQQAICREIQLLCQEQVPFIPLGHYIQPVAFCRKLTGMMEGVPVFTNLRKEA